MENSGDYAVVVLDLAGVIISWNPAAEKVLVWTAEEAIGQNTYIFFTEKDCKREQHLAEMRGAVQRGIGQDERWHVKKDGSLFWAISKMTALYKNGVLIGYSKILRDRIRERQTEERLRIAQYAGGIGSFELIPESGKIFPSEQFCRLWGESP